MGWVLTKGIEHLRASVNAAFPDRDKASDGTVGDLAHQVGTSGHNPDLTGKAEWKDGDKLDEVRAWDMDADLRTPGVTTQQLVDHIRGLPGVSGVLRYIIFNHKIYRASNGWKAEAYTGPSPHTEHVHFSGAYSQAADENTTFDYHLEDLVPFLDEQITLTESSLPLFSGAKVGDKRSVGQFIALGAIYAQRAAAKVVDVDEPAIAAAVLGGLTPEKLAAAFTAAGLTPTAIAAGIPTGIAKQVLDELQARLAS